MHKYVLVVFNDCLFFVWQVYNLLTNSIVIVCVDIFALEAELSPYTVELLIDEIARIPI